MRTSPSLGGSTVISSIETGLPASQATAALQVMTCVGAHARQLRVGGGVQLPAVDDEVGTRGGGKSERRTASVCAPFPECPTLFQASEA